MPKKKGKSSKESKKPFVSVCTPTYNRRPFINSMIKCFNHQTYPKDKLEWIIIDDGTDKIGDLVKDISCVKYFSYDEKMMLGKKRNLMHEKSKGDIIVYMDDDDYYPPVRIEHAVDMLLTHPSALCAGASEIYIYFKHIDKMIQFGPYGPNHATAGTFAFKRKLIENNRYNDEAALAEEKAFLNNYTVPFIQLEPKKTILVFSHIHNTFDKKTLLENPHPKFVRESDKTVDDFVKESDLKDFYMNSIEKLLEHYEPGRPEMKPDVLKQIVEIKKEREKMAAEQMKKQENRKIVTEVNGKQVELNNQQIAQILQQQQDALQKLNEELNKERQKNSEKLSIEDVTNSNEDKDEMLKMENNTLRKENNDLRNENEILKKEIDNKIVMQTPSGEIKLEKGDIVHILKNQQMAIQALTNQVNLLQKEKD